MGRQCLHVLHRAAGLLHLKSCNLALRDSGETQNRLNSSCAEVPVACGDPNAQGQNLYWLEGMRLPELVLLSGHTGHTRRLLSD